ncbi:asparagine--tRNA ligase [Buchnera aphidicola (Nipponaphis monzeni)]|uniref:Asparagine--tRNA ligase n=2 Tax=Buchnera aphidicola TaxID=9 RepID=A0A455TAB1_9GAMM|nr:asparagine--tRNA ligase [Buchnera aphidicola (Nipponaphis monzeni)]
MSIKKIFDEKIKVNTEVNIYGWVKNKRNSKMGFSFIDVYDGSCVKSLQVIVDSSVKNYFKELLFLTTGCSILVHGILVYSKGTKQKYEVQANKIKVIGWIKNSNKYPISSKKHTLEYLREVSHLRPRTNIFGVIIRIRNCFAHYLRNFLYLNDFAWVPTPIITELNAEGAGNMFYVSTLNSVNSSYYKKNVTDNTKNFFGKKTFLTVSGQLTLETYACAVSKVYTFGPTFRAESSNTTRHLSEFWMCEIEQAFSSLEDIILLAQNILKYTVKKVLDSCFLDIEFLEKNIDNTIIKRLSNFIENKFIEIEYDEAIRILKKFNNHFKEPVIWGMDISTEHERFFLEIYFLQPIIIKNYPKELKAFYMRLNKDEKTVAAMDILVPKMGEIIGGSQREERLKQLDQRLLECQLNIKDYWWYRDIRKYGTVPHSGFGLGFERFLCYITGLNNVKDMIPFPRTVNNSNF